MDSIEPRQQDEIDEIAGKLERRIMRALMILQIIVIVMIFALIVALVKKGPESSGNIFSHIPHKSYVGAPPQTECLRR